MITITLDSVKKYRGKTEWRTVTRASALGVEITADSGAISKLCKVLIAEGQDPQQLAEIWRGNTLCFHPAPLSVWAEARAGRGEQPEQLRRAAE